MDRLAYFLRRPAADWGPETLATFERVYERAIEPGTGGPIDYTLSDPKWQFLCYLCDRKDILLHGSGDPSISEFDPRQSNDVNAFGNRRAVYAASDGIWPMFFAIVDRKRYVTSLVNTCSRVVEDGVRSDPFYYFSINDDALPHAPWRPGTIYLLPRAGFEQEPQQWYRGLRVDHAHWASRRAVRPLARLAVEPEDFPFLTQVHGHSPEVVRARALADPQAFPWLD